MPGLCPSLNEEEIILELVSMAEIFITAWSPSFKPKLSARFSLGIDIKRQKATWVLPRNRAKRPCRCPTTWSLNATMLDGLTPTYSQF